MALTDKQITILQAPLDPAHVKKPSGNFGPKGDYIEGWHCINELNRVFGFDGWTYTIDLRRDALDRVEGKDQWAAAYTCVCTLEAAGVTRQDVGFGSGFAKGIGDAIEGATKEAATDALKRAARTFGNIFGLALYDKTRSNVCAPRPELIGPDDVTKIEILLEGNGIPIAELLRVGKLDKLTALPAEKVPGVMAWIEKQIAAKAAEAGKVE